MQLGHHLVLPQMLVQPRLQAPQMLLVDAAAAFADYRLLFLSFVSFFELLAELFLLLLGRLTELKKVTSSLLVGLSLLES